MNKKDCEQGKGLLHGKNQSFSNFLWAKQAILKISDVFFADKSCALAQPFSD